MATYLEIKDFLQDQSIIDRVTVAVVVKATLVEADNAATANQKSWARQIIAQAFPRGAAVEVLTRLLMASRASTVSQINNVVTSDTNTQTQVSAFLDTYLARLG